MNDIHPTAVIGKGVRIGEDNVIGPFVVILGPVELGDRNWLGPHVVIGTPAEIRDIDHGTEVASGDAAGRVGAGVHIGDNNVLREYTTVHQGHYARTVVGDGCYVMNKVYIGHDDVIGDRVTMASSVTLGGHVHVGADANLGLGALVHQRRVIGPGAMVGMGGVVTRDVPPYALAYGNPCRVRGANRVGMGRAGITEGVIEELHAAYAEGRPPTEPSDPQTADVWAWWKTETRPVT